MKHLLHVPTEQYGFISQEVEGSPQEAVNAYLELQRAWGGGEGVGMKALAAIIHEYCTTGAIVDGGMHDFSKNEQALVHEVQKIIRKNNK